MLSAVVYARYVLTYSGYPYLCLWFTGPESLMHSANIGGTYIDLQSAPRCRFQRVAYHQLDLRQDEQASYIPHITLLKHLRSSNTKSIAVSHESNVSPSYD